MYFIFITQRVGYYKKSILYQFASVSVAIRWYIATLTETRTDNYKINNFYCTCVLLKGKEIF
jgi:hypothetical protein